jgi:hypothetical protein
MSRPSGLDRGARSGLGGQRLPDRGVERGRNLFAGEHHVRKMQPVGGGLQVGWVVPDDEQGAAGGDRGGGNHDAT